MKRQRGRGGRKSNGQANRHFESNGPDIKIRGSASHIHEKYQQLARDAASSGDQVKAEGYLQHAEHYFRVLQSMQPAERKQRHEGGDKHAHGQDGQAGGQNTVQGNGDANGNRQAKGSGDQPAMANGEAAPDAMRVVHLDENGGEQPPADGNGFDASHAPAFLAAGPAGGSSTGSSGDRDGASDEDAPAPKRQRRSRRSRKTADAKPAADAQLALDQAPGSSAASDGSGDAVGGSDAPVAEAPAEAE